MDWTHLEPQLAHPDNDKRIHALAQLRQLLQDAQQLADPDHLATVLRTSLKASNAHVSGAALACLPPFFPLLVPTGSDPSHPSSSTAHSLRHALSLLLPLDRLGDAKPATRELAREGVVSAARACLRLGIDAGAKSRDGGPWQLVENGVREHGFASRNSKAREQALHFLAAVRCPPPENTVPLPPLRPFTPLLLPLLADPDSSVRSLALHTTIAVFSHASVSPAAKADLKKAMVKLDFAKKVQEQILSAVLGGAGAAALERSPSQASLSSTGGASEGSSSRSGATPLSIGSVIAAADGPARRLTRSQAASHGPGSAPHTPSLLASLPAAAFPADPSAVHVPAAAGDLAPVYVASEADLRGEFAQMHAAFQGKETEHNWMARDRHVAAIRGMLLGGVAKGELRTPFVQCVKEVQDGIMRTASSLRTTLAISALTLISELATSLPPSSLDLLLDPFLTHVLSMAGQTKKIVATASQATATTLITHSPYHLRTIQLAAALQGEKTPQARLFGAAHVLALLQQHGAHPALEPSGGADELEQAVARALRDPNAGVREKAREGWWAMRGQVGLAARAERVRDALDITARKLLDKAQPADAGADGAGSSAAATQEDKPVPAAARRTPAPAGAGPAAGAKKPSVKEMMLAKRREALAAAAREREAQGALPEGNGDGAAGLATPVRAQRPSTAEEGSPASSATPQATPTRAPAAASSAPATPATPSRAPAPPSTAARSPRIVPDRIVDDALREQALQAEQAAERLLELAEDDEAPAPAALATPSAPRTAPAAPSPALRTPAPNPALRRLGAAGGARIFADSPDARDAALGAGTKGTWWLARADQQGAGLAPPVPVVPSQVEDTPERVAEIDALVARVAKGEVDAQTLRAVAGVSRERVVRETSDEQDDPMGVFWSAEGRFERVYEGLRTWLLRQGAAAEGGSTRDQALLLLKDLVENQFPCFAGGEGGVFDLLFRLREEPSRTSIAATEAISSAFTARLEPLYGLGALVPALDAYLASAPAAPAASYALGLRQMGAFFELLPSEVLEDVLPRSAPLLKRALNDPTAPDLRRAALLALVSAHCALQGDAARLDALVGGLEGDQKSLLAYYAAKRGL
ncbi:suppressor of tub2 mutation [Rhodotorula kratochvilovae]